MSHGVGHQRGSDLAWLWLWRRPAAVAPIRPPAWERLCASGAALKKTKDKNKNKNKKRKPKCNLGMEFGAVSP